MTRDPNGNPDDVFFRGRGVKKSKVHIQGRMLMSLTLVRVEKKVNECFSFIYLFVYLKNSLITVKIMFKLLFSFN